VVVVVVVVVSGGGEGRAVGGCGGGGGGAGEGAEEGCAGGTDEEAGHCWFSVFLCVFFGGGGGEGGEGGVGSFNVAYVLANLDAVPREVEKATSCWGGGGRCSKAEAASARDQAGCLTRGGWGGDVGHFHRSSIGWNTQYKRSTDTIPGFEFMGPILVHSLQAASSSTSTSTSSNNMSIATSMGALKQGPPQERTGTA
jgi:hypothetical protein